MYFKVLLFDVFVCGRGFEKLKFDVCVDVGEKATAFVLFPVCAYGGVIGDVGIFCSGCELCFL